MNPVQFQSRWICAFWLIPTCVWDWEGESFVASCELNLFVKGPKLEQRQLTLSLHSWVIWVNLHKMVLNCSVLVFLCFHHISLNLFQCRQSYLSTSLVAFTFSASVSHHHISVLLSIPYNLCPYFSPSFEEMPLYSAHIFCNHENFSFIWNHD